MCEICLSTPCRKLCPNYTPVKTRHYCSVCNEGISNGEDYIQIDGLYAHLECVGNFETRELLKWLDITVQEMEDDDY